MEAIELNPAGGKNYDGSGRKLRKVWTRARVLGAARNFFETEGYEATTIRGIADSIGMSTGAIFANFESKAVLYAEVYGHAPLTPEQGRELLQAVKQGSLPPWFDAVALAKGAAF